MKYVYICSPFRPVGEDPETELRKNIDQAKESLQAGSVQGTHSFGTTPVFYTVSG